MDLESLGMTNPVPENAHSEELLYDKRFVKRWADICIEKHRAYGWEVANNFAKDMFSKPLLRLINKEIESRKK